jgi:hypothetical protein
MKRLTRLLWPLLFAGMVFAVYHLKAQVEEREKELARIQSAIDEEREAIQMLRAEWSYLNRPDRLRQLAARLELAPVAARQLASFERFAQRLADAAPLESGPRQAALPDHGYGPR